MRRTTSREPCYRGKLQQHGTEPNNATYYRFGGVYGGHMVGTRKSLRLVPQLVIRDDPERTATVSHLHASKRSQTFMVTSWRTYCRQIGNCSQSAMPAT